MRIYRRLHDGEPFAWESLPGVKPILSLPPDKAASGSWRTIPGGDVVGLVRYRVGEWDFSTALHEVQHILLRTRAHHSKWHFCSRADSQGWRLIPLRCSTRLQRDVARRLLKCPDGQWVDA